MKNRISIVIVMLIFFSVNALAQEKEMNSERKAKMEELRSAYIQEELNLTDEEAETFMPVLKTHHEQKKGIRKSMREIKKAANEGGTQTKEAFLANLDKLSDLKIEEVNIDKHFAKEAVSILGVQRTMKLKEVEKKFRSEMRQKRDGKKGQGQGGNKGNHGGHMH